MYPGHDTIRLILDNHSVPLLARIDLQTSEAIPLVSDAHNSKDYIAFLENLMADILRETSAVLYWIT